jgi:hypothetical protein
MRPAFVLLLVLAAMSSARAQESFFAPPQPSGVIEVRLYPTEVVTSGQQKLVTFGVPFPRGSITAAQLATLRVTKGGNEVPAHVTQLTPWRHRSNAAIDGQSVRVARVQIQNTFTTLFPGFETIEVSWGGTPRTLDVPGLTNPRSAWHQVTSGTFNAADNVFEPDVYAVLPREWLAAGVLKPSRSLPFDPTNTEPRDSPATNDGILHWPGTQESERAFKNNFYTVINRDDPSVVDPAVLCPYKTLREPWLYDRAATMFVLYFRSGFFSALREAVRATEFYAGRVDANGFFTLDGAGGDAKYAYNESMAYSHWTTADDTHLTRIGNTTLGLGTFNHVWTPALGFWTERHAAFKLLGNVVAYEVLGGTARRDSVNAILLQYRNHQDDTGNQIPATTFDGGLYHLGQQHDNDWAAGAFGGSSWMSALLSDAAVRAYATGEDAATAQFVARLGRFLQATVVVTTQHSYGTSAGVALALPRYAMLIDGSAGQQNTSDVEHGLDVAGQVAWADYFARVGGTPDPTLAASAQALYATHDASVNEWIRPTAPPVNTAFRVNPWRKWGWEHRTSDGYGWALAAGSPPPLFANGFENP